MVKTVAKSRIHLIEAEYLEVWSKNNVILQVEPIPETHTLLVETIGKQDYEDYLNRTIYNPLNEV